MSTLREQIADLEPTQYARDAHAAARSAKRRAERLGRAVPASALEILAIPEEELARQRAKAIEAATSSPPADQPPKEHRRNPTKPITEVMESGGVETHLSAVYEAAVYEAAVYEAAEAEEEQVPLMIEGVLQAVQLSPPGQGRQYWLEGTPTFTFWNLTPKPVELEPDPELSQAAATAFAIGSAMYRAARSNVLSTVAVRFSGGGHVWAEVEPSGKITKLMGIDDSTTRARTKNAGGSDVVQPRRAEKTAEGIPSGGILRRTPK
ncbi:MULTISPECIES: hypothetical protein [unclassified Rhodococcus (in: high G+C Gram-positive bacteria)]|uniref:hypothetical protein n=1 Tax=unclassified Rhodococcus (in: high G+C Gram-positive bacteria) TaxID=192944 RepID=UPI0012F6FF26|nr:hypothetical protein [Rhodococcus sp. DK17]